MYGLAAVVAALAGSASASPAPASNVNRALVARNNCGCSSANQVLVFLTSSINVILATLTAIHIPLLSIPIYAAAVVNINLALAAAVADLAVLVTVDSGIDINAFVALLVNVCAAFFACVHVFASVNVTVLGLINVALGGDLSVLLWASFSAFLSAVVTVCATVFPGVNIYAALCAAIRANASLYVTIQACASLSVTTNFCNLIGLTL